MPAVPGSAASAVTVMGVLQYCWMAAVLSVQAMPMS